MTIKFEMDKEQRIAWAKAYPFDVPERSYLYARSKVHALARYRLDAWADAEIEHEAGAVLLREAAGDDVIEALGHRRHAVIACGSNAAPRRLAQKYDNGPSPSVVPTLRITLFDHAIVHAANFTAYGSVPATLTHAPGARVSAFVNLLTDQQLEVMDETEGGYDRVRLGARSVQLEDGSWIEHVEAYISHHGCLRDEDRPIALATARGEEIPFASMSQIDVQGHAQRVLGVAGALDDFIHENVSNPALRRERSLRLKQRHSLPARVAVHSEGRCHR